MSILAPLATALVLVLLIAQLLLVAYLLLLTASALLARPRAVPSTIRQQRRFAVLIPAHDEEALIGRALESFAQQDYPRESYDVCVVADNCEDATAAVARSWGARVYERSNDAQRAKGFALQWLIEQLRQDGRVYDAFVVVDADSIVAPNLLRSFDARLEQGASVVQAYYAVLNAQESALAGLRYAALAALHYLRPLGRARFGLSAGLKGNGMCFAAPIIEQFAWRWFSLAEDVEFHLALVEHGVRVEFAPETWVRADMPVTMAQAASQNSRWESGRLQLIRSHVPRLLWLGLRQRSWMQVDAAVEQLIPPLSLPFVLAIVCLGAGLALGNGIVAFAALGCLISYAAYVVAALVLVRAPVRIYLALGTAPAYIAWKVVLYGQSLFSSRTSAWVRTPRAPGGATSI